MLFTLLLPAVILPTIATCQTTWTGAGGNDNWFTAGNWNTGVVPDGSTFDVIVNSPSPTLVQNGAPSINSLQVGSNGIVNLIFGQGLGFSGTATNTLTNQGGINFGAGVLQLSNTVNNSGSISGSGDLLLQSGGATLTGGGTITLENSILAEISGVADSVLTIEDQTIEGQGQIGVDSIELINNGLIDANNPSGNLNINPSVGGMVNTGTMQASGGGQLLIFGQDGDVYDNTGGTILALADSEVVLAGSPEIIGGLLTTTGTGGFFTGAFQSPLLSDVTHTGSFEIGGGGVLRISGIIDNSGSILNNNGSLLTEDSGGATLTGGGTVTLVFAADIGGVPGSILTIEDQTIEGQGIIGNNQIGLINQGLIDANVAGLSMVINPGIDGMVNTGTMQASGGSLLILQGSSGGTYHNTGGTIQALADSEVRHQFQFGNSEIVGGLLTSTGTGFHSIESLTATDVTNTGQIFIGGAGALRMKNTFTSSGTIGCTGTIITESGDVILTGGGTIMLDGSSKIRGNPGTTLVIENQTIEGRGSIGFNEINFTSTANSVFHANVSGTELTMDPVGDADILWVNEGMLLASNGATLNSRHITTNNGTIEVESGGRFRCERQLTCTVGSLLTGDGTVLANSTNTSFQSIFLDGTVAPGSSPGTLLLSGAESPSGVNSLDVTMGSTAELQIELASAESFDLLEFVGDSIGLNGTLSVTLLDGFVPNASDTFLIVNGNFANLSGSFNNGSSIVCVSGGGTFDINYITDSGSVTLTNYQPGSVVLGDVNLDCNINLLDVAPFIDRISTGTYQAEADANEDGVVNLLDVQPFVALLSN